MPKNPHPDKEFPGNGASIRPVGTVIGRTWVLPGYHRPPECGGAFAGAHRRESNAASAPIAGRPDILRSICHGGQGAFRPSGALPQRIHRATESSVCWARRFSVHSVMESTASCSRRDVMRTISGSSRRIRRVRIPAREVGDRVRGSGGTRAGSISSLVWACRKSSPIVCQIDAPFPENSLSGR